jgi:hypothetical protein
MKNNLLLLLVLVAGYLAQNDLARAQILVDGDFEGSAKPVGTDKVATGFATIPGWKDIGTAANNSGVQYGTSGDALNNSQAGSYFAFQDSDDGNGANRGAYQVTNTVLHAGDQVTLTWYAVNTTGTPTQNVNLLAAPARDAAFDAATVLPPGNNPVLTLNETYTKYTVTYTATAADAGKYLGVSFGTTGANNSFVQYDSFVLTVVASSK